MQIRGVIKRNKRYFKISRITYVLFSLFSSAMLVHMSIIRSYVDNISHFGLSVCFGMLFAFLQFEKMDQRNCLSFV